MNNIKERIIIGMSGGVDSSVAALLLKRQKFDVVGVFMKNWVEENDDGICTAAQDYDDVRRVCDKIGIPYYTVNFAKEYKERVFSYFLNEYKAGRTPNPDVLCNCEIKFKAFLEFALAAEAKAFATGHYARLDKRSRGVRLLRAKDPGKDQTYFLAGLTATQLENVLFPVGDLMKSEVRALAAEAGLSTALKKDSTGICFIGERNFKEFLMQYLPAQPGDMVDEKGRIIGKHDGLMYYTLGQRRGLGIGGRSCGSGESWFVIGKDVERNLLIVQQGEHEELFSTELMTEKPNWISGSAPGKIFACTAKFRYRQPDQKVIVYSDVSGCRVEFGSPQRAVTPGQWAVFYNGDTCLGGAPIRETVPLKAIRI